jgi:hypothetical protein
MKALVASSLLSRLHITFRFVAVVVSVSAELLSDAVEALVLGVCNALAAGLQAGEGNVLVLRKLSQSLFVHE